MSSSHVDRNLLFGILAVQMDFVTRDALIAAMHAWVLQKSKPLGQVLVEQGALPPKAQSALDALVEQHLDLHRGDPRQSLAAVGLPPDVERQLDQVDDPEIRASLVRLAEIAPASPSQQTTLPVGDSASDSARFEILRSHAWGGLGEVYVAQDREMNREVALKRLHERHARSADSRARFLREAEITGGLEHPGIVPVYGLGMSEDGRPYYAMRLIRGETLKEGIAHFHCADARTESERRIELRQLLGRFIAVCNAVEYAHSRGVIHRDLKPSNIMLGKYGETLVVDWGLCKALGHREAAVAVDERTLVPSSGSGSSDTLPGSAIGTPAYMSPEQSDGRIDEMGPVSDVYSLGATLYTILTGKEPFESANIADILKKVRTGDFAPPCEQNPSVPRSLNAICLKAMQLSAKDRYPSCAALTTDIEHWLADEPVSALKDPFSDRMIRWIKRHRVMTSAIAALVVTLLVSLLIGTAVLGRANTAIRTAAGETAKQRDEATGAREVADTQRKAADTQRKVADEQRALAESREQTARQYLYVSQMSLAHQAWDRGRVQRVVELLDDQRPQPGQRDLRGFDWYYRWRLCHSERLTLPVRDRQVLSVAISPDGKTLATSTNVIELWDLPAATLRAKLAGHKGDVNVIVFSPDGTMLASASDDFSVKLWDVRNAREAATFNGHTDQVLSVAFSPDGKTLASGGLDASIRFWRVPRGFAASVSSAWMDLLTRIAAARNPAASIDRLIKLPAKVFCVTFSPDGKTLASSGRDNVIRLWDSQTGKLRSTLRGHKDAITPLAFSPDGRVLASGSDDTTVKLWEVQSGLELATLSGHSHWVESLAFSGDSRFLASGSRDNTIRVWQFNRPTSPNLTGDNANVSGAARWPADAVTEWTLLKGHTGQVSSLAFAPDNQTLASASEDKTAKLWDVARGQEQVTLHGHRGRNYCVAFSPDGRLVASGSDDATVRLWDVATRLHRTTLPQTDRVNSLAFTRDGKTLATGCSDGTIKLWDVASGRERPGNLMTNRPAVTSSVVFSPNGKLLISGDANGFLTIWNVESRRKQAAVQGLMGFISAVVFSPDGKSFAASGRDAVVRLWDIESRSEKSVLQADVTPLTVIALSPDGKTLASGSADAKVKLWDLATKQVRATLQGHTAGVDSIAFSHDGKLVASAGDDASAILWDAATGQDLVTLRGHATEIEAIAFSPDDKTLATASFDQTVKLWNIAPATQADVLAYDKEHAASAKALTATKLAFRYNNEARMLATNRNVTQRNPTLAVELAKKAVELDSTNSIFWNTLGIANYRAGDWGRADAALRRSMSLREGGDSVDWFWLAMTLWQRGDKVRAVKWYRAARLTMARVAPKHDELLSFRTEAAALLGRPEIDPSDKTDDLSLVSAQLEAEPDRAPLYFFRGSLHAHLGNWARAIDDLNKAIDLGGKQLVPMYFRALILLRMRNNAEYQRRCAEMLKEFVKTDDAQTASFVAWSCALAPASVADLAPAIGLAEKAVKKEPGIPQYAGSLGAILYRAGRLQDAVGALERSDALTADAARSSPAYTWFFLAMAHERLQHAADARRWLSKAQNQADIELKHENGATAIVPWNRRLTLTILRHEAEALIGTGQATPPKEAKQAG